MDDLKRARRLSIVERWSIIPTIRRQNVADHSFQVANIVRHLMEHHESCNDPTFRARALEHALDHDKGEAIAGDAPGGPSKKKDFKSLINERGQVYGIVKLADLIEATTFLQEEKALGNRQVQPIIDGYMDEIRYVIDLIHWKYATDRVRTIVSSMMGKMLGLDVGDFQ